MHPPNPLTALPTPHTGSAAPTALWLVRHARVLPPWAGAASTRPLASAHCHGHTNWPADPEHTQTTALALAHALTATTGLGLPPLRVRCSPLHRCEQLGHALKALNPDWALECDPRLAELNFGAWEGLPWDDVARTELDAWAADFSGHRLGGHGETVHGLVQRVALAAHHTVGTAAKRGEARESGEVREVGQTETAGLLGAPSARATVWITHAGVIRAMLWLQQRGWPLHPPAPQAHEWPTEAPAPGGWCTVALPTP